MDPHLITFFDTRNLLFLHPHFLSAISVKIHGSLSFSGKSANMSVNIDGSLSLAEIFQVSTFSDPHLRNFFRH